MTLITIDANPVLILPVGSQIRKNDARLSPSNCPFFAILVSDRKLSLSPHELFVGVELAPVAPVVEDGVFGGIVPLSEVEEAVEVHVVTKRSGPLGFAQSGSSPNNERFRSV